MGTPNILLIDDEPRFPMNYLLKRFFVDMPSPVPRLPNPKRLQPAPHQGAKEKARRLKQLARQKAVYQPGQSSPR